MGNPVGQSHKPIHIRGSGSKSFPSFTTEGKNKLKTMLLSEGKKKEKNRNKINGRYKKIIIRFA